MSKKIFFDKEVIVWERKIYHVPDALTNQEIVNKIQNNELTPDSFEYIDGYKPYDEGREEIFDDNNKMLFSK